MGRLWTNVADCNYKEYGRLLTEQFIHGLDDEGRISGILKEVLTLQDTGDVTSERVPLWAQRVEVHREQKEAVNNIKEDRDFDSGRHIAQKHDSEAYNKQKRE